MNVKIEKLVYGGDGLGHAEGNTVFVPYVLPDEVVAIRPVERKKKFVRGQLAHIVQPATGRAVPPCSHFTACGGCHYQHIAYEEQLRFKVEILRETLRRIGRVEWPGSIEAHASPPLGYRNRTQWKIRAAEGRHAIGYFRAGSTSLCPVDECPILSPRLAETLLAVRRMLDDGDLPPSLREVEAFADDSGERLLLNASLADLSGGAAGIAETLREGIPGAETILIHDSARDRYELFGPGFIQYGVAGRRYRVGHLSFFQVNRFLIEAMVQTVVAGATGKLALDLFAGVGLFTVPLAGAFERIAAVESNEAAARDLETNAAGKPVQAVARDVQGFLSDYQDAPDFVILDPPRAGVEPAALQRLLALAPPQVVYVSCDPSTLARDLGALASQYAIREIHVFDVFPQTYHIESIVKLERK